VHDARETVTGWFGLGLSLSRSIVESNGGWLWAEPNGGAGAVCTPEIPRAPERHPTRRS
jgi:signal transduction histidine kinase